MEKDPYQEREAKKYSNPIASREFILDCLISAGQPVAFRRLAKILQVGPPAQQQALKNRLAAMVRAGQLIVDRRQRYAIASQVELLTGKVTAHPDGYGFLIQEGPDEDVFLTRRQMRQVFHGDVVNVRIRGRDRRGRSEGEIVEVVEHNTRQLVGRCYFENDISLLEPLNNRINHEILLRLKPGHTFDPGQIVVARIIEQPGLHGLAVAEVMELLGDHLTPGIEVEIALRNHDIPTELTNEVLEAVDRMPAQVRPGDKLNRYDLTELPFVTIDGEDARDFDDAVYCEKREGSGWRLYVAIADVSHYVKTGSVLDQSARQRGTSVYFPQYVVPMLPEKLSNGLCSLNPKVDRLVLVCEMKISARGRVSSYQFYEGVINSRVRLTYTEVARAIGSESGGDVLDEKLLSVITQLDELHGLYQKLFIMRQQRGAIEFDTTELQFHFSADGHVEDIQPRTRNIAHRIIEECMLCANVCAARLITSSRKPGLYRVHEPPEAEKVEYLAGFLANFGIELKIEDNIKPSAYQMAVSQLRDMKNGHVLQMALLRSMNQAVYQPQNKGHFGLGYREYTHFTSPIRRYPDLLTHRLIKSVIHDQFRGKNTESDLVLRLGKPDKTDFYPYETEQIVELGESASFKERRAETAVYEVIEWIKCDYISHRVGDIVEGVITGVTKFGFFVELAGVFVEGLVHISSLLGDYYHYDQSSQCLVGERSHVNYRLGDMVQVQIVRVNVDDRKVDFKLVSHSPLAPHSTLRQSRKKTREKRKSAGSTAQRGRKMSGQKVKKGSSKGRGQRQKSVTR